MAPQQPSAKRIKTLSICCPIIYGNTARLLKDEERTPETPESHTHKWKVFVRNPLDEGEEGDKILSRYIKKVSFKLHDTYTDATRMVESAPFEVEETGWGEFDIQIRIYFHNEANEKHVFFNHRLQLHPYLEKDKGKDVVTSVQFDEIVFNEPTELIFEKLTSKPGNMIPEKTGSFNRNMERQEVHRLNTAIATVNKQISELRKHIVEKSGATIANTVTR